MPAMDRIIGCGVDIEEPVRFEKYLKSGEGVSGFLKMVFTPEEIARNRALSPHLSFPLGFSCKEAVFKAFGRSWTNSAIDWKDVELIFGGGRDLSDYQVRLSGYAKTLFEEMGCTRLDSSFEYHRTHVIFQVFLIGS